MTHNLSVVVISGNLNSKTFKKCIKSLNEYKEPERIEIIAIESGISKEFNHSLEINRALKIVKYENILLIDDDIIFLPNWFQNYIKIIKNDKEQKIGIVGATLLNKNKKIIHTGGLISPQCFGFEINEPIREIVERDYVASAFMFIRKDLKEKIMFDENLKKYGMDADYCFQARKLGYKVVCSPDIKAIHNINTTKKKLGNLNLLLKDDKKYFYKKWQYPFVTNEKYIAITKRGVIYPTFACNINCEFCYYKFNHSTHHRPIEEVKKELDLYKNFYNLEYIDISGGEPTIYKNIEDMIEYCNQIELKPTIITNGQLPERIKKIIEIGVEDILLSYHDIEEYYNKITYTKNGYEKLLKTIEIMKEKNFTFRTNTTLTKENMERLPKIAEKLGREIKPRIVNFICFNPHPGTDWGNVKNDMEIPFQAKYSEIAPYLKEAIEILNSYNIFTNVRYFPLCCLVGYEKHICNFHQWQWDPYEWDLRSGLKLSKKYWAQKLSIKVFFSQIKARHKIEKKYLWLTKNVSCKKNIFLKTCKKCSYYKICDGIYPQYYKRFGGDEFIPVIGKKIEDPIYFRLQDLRWNILK
ncbi:MAG TPA: radical SAM protein [bacterium]|nr:radical SAM protein [bacterium]